MDAPDTELDPALVAAKWYEIAPGIDNMAKRIADPKDFPVLPGSSLYGDDKAAGPYQVSHAVRLGLVAGVDHLHAAKSLILDMQVLHATALYSLIRGSLEALATAFWILHPPLRDQRVENTLRWNAKNFREQCIALNTLGTPDREAQLEERLKKLEAIAVVRNIPTADVRAGYRSSRAVEYADKHLPNASPLLPWQICSGFAHGRPWAILGLSHQELQEPSDLGVLNMKLTSDVGRVLFPALAAFRLLGGVVELLSLRSGTAQS